VLVAVQARPLEKLLDSYFTTPDGKTLTLKDMLRPVLITSYDVSHPQGNNHLRCGVWPFEKVQIW
jgi:hypothetical protein